MRLPLEQRLKIFTGDNPRLPLSPAPPLRKRPHEPHNPSHLPVSAGKFLRPTALPSIPNLLIAHRELLLTSPSLNESI
jgi:hypothetical protein